jgi:hypothetical protein
MLPHARQNFPFLETRKIRTIISLIPEKPTQVNAAVQRNRARLRAALRVPSTRGAGYSHAPALAPQDLEDFCEFHNVYLLHYVVERKVE